MQISFVILCWTLLALNLREIFETLTTPFRRLEYSLYKSIADYEKHSFKGRQLFPDVKELQDTVFLRIKNFKISDGKKDMEVYAAYNFVNKMVLKKANEGDYAPIMNGLPRGREVHWRIANRDMDNRLILEADLKSLKGYDRQRITAPFERNGEKLHGKTVQVSGYYVEDKIIIGGGLRRIDTPDIRPDDPNAPKILETVTENPPTNFAGITYQKKVIPGASESVFFTDEAKRSLAVTPNLNYLQKLAFPGNKDYFILPFRKRLDLKLQNPGNEAKRVTFEGVTSLARHSNLPGNEGYLRYERPVKLKFVGDRTKDKITLLWIESLEFLDGNTEDADIAKIFLNKHFFNK